MDLANGQILEMWLRLIAFASGFGRSLIASEARSVRMQDVDAKTQRLGCD